MSTVKEYLDSLPADRKKALTAIRKVIKANLPKGYEEKINWGMISYQVPLKVFPDTYNGQPLLYLALASQKNYISIHLCQIYADSKLQKWFTAEYKKTGKKLDMGKGCLRFKSLDDVPLELIGQVAAKTEVEQYLASYQKSRAKKKK